MAMILIVDDSLSIRRMMSSSLTAEGHTVLECKDGGEALQEASKQTFDLVITDLNMPGIDGLQLTRKLRSLPATADRPILILTTETSAARKAEAKTAGASGWLLKPFREETLVRAIQTVLAKSGV
ncbi:response regulator [Bremerella sp. JC817]|uniref:response regulator n=1 Tax=Bremerella sp. JC817 TaxID=3231756 RepID=UPI00345B1A92